MTKSIDVYAPDGTVTYTEGVDGVVQINVRYSFANVVDVRIYYSATSFIHFYQVACKVTTTP